MSAAVTTHWVGSVSLLPVLATLCRAEVLHEPLRMAWVVPNTAALPARPLRSTRKAPGSSA
ncbi:hypothetical protein D3C71_1154610 [compost metagenome]